MLFKLGQVVATPGSAHQHGAVPWALLGAATVGVVIVVGSVSVMTTLAETRPRPVDVAGARE